jgi:hypothetical protein
MARLAPSILLLTSLCLGPSGCKQAKGIDIDAKQLIPAEANVAFGFQLDPVRKSPLAPALAGAMRGDRDFSAVMDAAGTCNVSLEPLHGFFAGKLESEDKYFAVIESPGLGDEDIVRCIEEKSTEITGGKKGLILFETRGDVRITPQEGGGYLIILNKDAIAVVDRAWEDAVFAAIEQPAARNTDTALTKALAGVDPSSHIWIAAPIAEADVADMGDVPGADALRSVAMSLDLSAGIGLDVNLGFADAEKAGVFRTAMPTLAEEIAPALGEAGLPTDLLASLKVAGEGSMVNAKLQIASEAIPGLVGTMTALMAQP